MAYWTVSDVIRYAYKKGYIKYEADVRGYVEYVMDNNLNYNKDMERRIYQLIEMTDDNLYYPEEVSSKIAEIIGYY